VSDYWSLLTVRGHLATASECLRTAVYAIQRGRVEIAGMDLKLGELYLSMARDVVTEMGL